jgi:hypothetical protein
MTEVDQRLTLAAEYLAEAKQRSVEQMPPRLLMRECTELRRLLGQVLDVLAAHRDAAAQLAEIRRRARQVRLGVRRPAAHLTGC